jgi:glutathione S-transferase
MTNKFRLITIPISHYSEKARWAMDYQKAAVKPCAFRPGISGDGISDSSRSR